MKRGPIHGYYFLLPIFTAAFWLTDILGLLGLWGSDGFIKYEDTSATIAFISTVGAYHHTFFIVFSCLTAASYVLVVLLERHLRHLRRIPGSLRKRQTVLDILSLVFAIIGAIGLVILSVCDTIDYPTVHWSMTVVFIVFVALSVFVQTWEVFSLAKSHDHWVNTLRRVAIIKSILLGIAVLFAIGFVTGYAICSGDALRNDTKCQKAVSVAGAFEWSISLVLFFFFLTYIVDLWPAKKTAEKGLSEDGTHVVDTEMAENSGNGDKPIAPFVKARDMGPNHSEETYREENAAGLGENGTTAYGKAPEGKDANGNGDFMKQAD